MQTGNPAPGYATNSNINLQEASKQQMQGVDSKTFAPGAIPSGGSTNAGVKRPRDPSRSVPEGRAKKPASGAVQFNAISTNRSTTQPAGVVGKAPSQAGKPFPQAHQRLQSVSITQISKPQQMQEGGFAGGSQIPTSQGAKITSSISQSQATSIQANQPATKISFDSTPVSNGRTSGHPGNMPGSNSSMQQPMKGIQMGGAPATGVPLRQVRNQNLVQGGPGMDAKGNTKIGIGVATGRAPMETEKISGSSTAGGSGRSVPIMLPSGYHMGNIRPATVLETRNQEVPAASRPGGSSAPAIRPSATSQPTHEPTGPNAKSAGINSMGSQLPTSASLSRPKQAKSLGQLGPNHQGDTSGMRNLGAATKQMGMMPPIKQELSSRNIGAGSVPTSVGANVVANQQFQGLGGRNMGLKPTGRAHVPGQSQMMVPMESSPAMQKGPVGGQRVPGDTWRNNLPTGKRLQSAAEILAAGPQTRSRVVRASDDDNPSALLVYVPGGSMPNLHPFLQSLIEVRVQASFLSSHSYEISTRKIWGGPKSYTEDSDVVAMLLHSGKFPVRAACPKGIAGVAVILRISPGEEKYPSSRKHGLLSRKWPTKTSMLSLQIVRTSTIPIADADMFVLKTRRGRDSRDSSKTNPHKAKILYMGNPDKMYSRHAQKFLNKNRYSSEHVFCFTPEGDVACRDVLPEIRDHTMYPQSWTIDRFKDHALYLGTADGEFELKKEAGKDTYRLSQITDLGKSEYKVEGSKSGKRKLRGKNDRVSASVLRCVPLKAKSVKDVVTEVEWEELEWHPSYVIVGTKKLLLKYIKFRPIFPS
mmetsp:Transcript_5563/g.8218  ORF Transcript_5563/g.8218 Transcript_5563/m.8218 type:complete len:813 (-) Transcript_5563:196-2634(-)